MKLSASYSRFNLKAKKIRELCVRGFSSKCDLIINIDRNVRVYDDLIIGYNLGIGKNSIIGKSIVIGKNVMIGRE